MNQVVVASAAQVEKQRIQQLIQFYIYDITEYTGAAIQEDGTYRPMPDIDKYWDDPISHHPYLITVNDEAARFLLIRVRDEQSQYYDFAHLFVMRKFRRTGVGRIAAKCIFQQYGGEWELHQLENNIPAHRFWDKVIDEISDGTVTVKNGERKKISTFCLQVVVQVVLVRVGYMT
ncbi:hypothetical protein AZ66_11625 [Paenibacillus sp. E194]|uniref:GNAT family N-acetyltransferase n=1 Tax=Paenibacillus sp. E194 TaxID=1458845 RepID=UPI0005E574E3|nr:GNAT family N-acetyltransferase [Paenibacillus sp. E194]KJB87695.1 hypothetical protein AZ66_11625 [Paenibacillus sp. E194]